MYVPPSTTAFSPPLHSHTNKTPDNPLRVVVRQRLLRQRRRKRLLQILSSRHLQTPPLQLLQPLTPTLLPPRLHLHGHNIRPHQHPPLAQETRNRPRHRRTPKVLRADKVAFREE